MKKKFLVTTADEKTWFENKPMLFLGEWCKIYNRREIWNNLDTETVPYHWDDRRKLYSDYTYLQGLYEEVLEELSAKLNEVHKTSYSIRYWRILIGPWLIYFLEILFDRWEMICKANSEYTITGVKILDEEPYTYVPENMTQFNSIITKDSWNEAIYGELIKGWTGISVELIAKPQNEYRDSGHSSKSLIGQLKHKIFHLVSRTTQMFVQKKEAYFVSTYLPLLQNLQLQLHLKQMPRIWESIATPKSKFDRYQRDWKLSNGELKGFPEIVRTLIPRHIPTCYLEGYTALVATYKSLAWPQEPDLIFTSNSFFWDDVFKAWTAKKVEEGTPLVIGQHGGNYGMCPMGVMDEHEYAICDKWLSWGWKDNMKPKIIPTFNLKMIGSKQKWNPEGAALMVGMLIPRYSYRLLNFPIASQWLSYFDDQCRFILALPVEIRKKVIVRLQYPDYEWNQEERWKANFSDIAIDIGKTPIHQLIKKTRIYISTYNATTFLESMILNIPTIIFWDEHYFELNEKAIPYFEKLKMVGIFHRTPESAAKHMTLVWDNISAWWNSEGVQEVCKEFCCLYSRKTKHPVRVLKKILQDTSIAHKG